MRQRLSMFRRAEPLLSLMGIRLTSSRCLSPIRLSALTTVRRSRTNPLQRRWWLLQTLSCLPRHCLSSSTYLTEVLAEVSFVESFVRASPIKWTMCVRAMSHAAVVWFSRTSRTSRPSISVSSHVPPKGYSSLLPRGCTQ